MVTVRVSPRSRHNEVGGTSNGALLVRTTAPPADGKANKTVIKLLAGFLGVAPSRIRLVRGHRHRDKQFVVKDAANSL